jgi:hypothetical protein
MKKEIMSSAKNYKKNVESHSSRCPDCKNVIKTMLRKIYGDYPNFADDYKVDTLSQLKDYKGSSFYAKLKKIYKKLEKMSPNKRYVRSKYIQLCDIVVKEGKKSTIIEIDESQHFSKSREASLLLYPKHIKLGFNKEVWIKLCKKINAHDPTPPYRDQQRAWYDTLRDFMPQIDKSFSPTVRIYLNDYQWCNLNPKIKKDVKKFSQIIFEGKEHSFRFARIITGNNYNSSRNAAKSALELAAKADITADYLTTPGGFIVNKWPGGLDDKESLENNPKPLIRAAKKEITKILTSNLADKLAQKFKYITIGIDSKKNPEDAVSDLHVELVFVYDLKNKKIIGITGKSYPVIFQEKTLVKIKDLNSHFMKIGSEKVLILGCHDLNIFSPRGDKTAKGWRKKIKKEFLYKVSRFKPVFVIQHPHTTGNAHIWGHSWKNLTKKVESIQEYSSSFNFDGKQRDYERTLEKTAKGSNYVIKGNKSFFPTWGR